MFKLDRIKLIHWLNIRKITIDKFVDDSNLDRGKFPIENDVPYFEISLDESLKIASYLSVNEEQLAYTRGEDDENGFIFQSKDELYKTKRLVERDGIDFYNYYTLPAPKGYVAPVILDILCPLDKLPKLNNGHFEAAITINLGPGPINGRWGEEINELNFSVLDSNEAKENKWITGASYFEPSYCPHTYSLASSKPAKILSYTVANTLDEFLTRLNSFSYEQQHNYEKSLQKPLTERLIAHQMSLLGFNTNSLSQNSGISDDIVRLFEKGNFNNLAVDTIKQLCEVINLDFRLILLPKITGDKLGKTIFSVQDSIKTIRKYKNFTWASVASSINSPDLTGAFLKVENKTDISGLQETDFIYYSKNSHYLVTSGNLKFITRKNNGELTKQSLSSEDSLWVKPFQSHSFIGNGSLIKMSNGEGVDYTNDFSLGNLFSEQNTMKRALNDNLNWGYD